MHPLPDRAFKTSPFRAGFGAPTGLKAGVLNQQGKRINYSDSSGEKEIAIDDVLVNPDKLKLVEPNTQDAVDDIAYEDRIAAAPAANTADPVSGNGIQLLTQAGGIFGQSVAIAAGTAGVITNLFHSIHSPKNVPAKPGMLKITGVIVAKQSAKNLTASDDVYVASSTPEKPEDLIDAGVKQIVVNFKSVVSAKVAITNNAIHIHTPPIMLLQPAVSYCESFQVKLNKIYSGDRAFLYQSYENEGCKFYRDTVVADTDADPLAGVDSIFFGQEIKSQQNLVQIITHTTSQASAFQARAFVKKMLGLSDSNPTQTEGGAITSKPTTTQVIGTIAPSASSATPNDAGKAVADTAQMTGNGRDQK